MTQKGGQLVGNFAAGGREYEPVGEPRKVLVHDFADKDLGKVAPNGVMSDIAANTGWVNVGADADADTGQFAVRSIRRWWNTMGSNTYPGLIRLLKPPAPKMTVRQAARGFDCGRSGYLDGR